MLKNNIEIYGLTTDENLKKLVYDKCFIKSDTNYIFLGKKIHPKDIISIDISIDPQTESEFTLNDYTLINIEGNKIYKILFLDDRRKSNQITTTMPFSTCFKLPLTESDFEEYDIHILDATYKQVSSRIIYENIILLTTIFYSDKNKSNFESYSTKLPLIDNGKNDSLSIYDDNENMDVENSNEYAPNSKNDIESTKRIITNSDILKASKNKDNELSKDVDINEEFF